MDVLDLRQLNRATLARQGLLERATTDVATVVRAVGGLQAQTPANPVVAVWSRLAGFERPDLVDAVGRGELVRGTTLRGTLHLHHVDEYRELRMTLQPMLDGVLRMVRRRVREADIEPALREGMELLRRAPRTIGDIKRDFHEHFPESDPQALAHVVRYGMQLLMVPDLETPNGYPNVAKFARWQDLLDGELDPRVQLELLVTRFLEVLGPGSARDAQVWSGVRGLKPVIRAMLEAGELVTVTTHEGDELVDLPGAPRPDGDEPCAVRFLPMWDNLLLSHADRSRVLAPEDKPYIASKNGMPPPTFLVDGFVAGTWRVEREGAAATLRLAAFRRTPKAAQDALVDEGDALLRIVEPGAAERRVRFD